MANLAQRRQEETKKTQNINGTNRKQLEKW